MIYYFSINRGYRRTYLIITCNKIIGNDNQTMCNDDDKYE